MKKFSVAHLVSAHSPFDERVFQKECKSLAQAGYGVTLIAPHQRFEMADGVYIRAIPKFTSRIGRMTASLWHVLREALRQDADLYHFHDLELIPAGLLLRAWGKKVVYDIHEDYPRRGIFCKSFVPGWRRLTLGWLLERAENLASRNFSALVPATPAIASRFLAKNRRTAVIQNFPSLRDFGPIPTTPWNQRSPSVAYVGLMSGIRGTQQIIDAMDLLPPKLNATLKLAGSFFPTTFREQLARSPGWKRVEVLGFIEHKQIVQMLGTVRAGLVTFHPEPNHIRAQPTKLFEYMAAGLPVIASDFPLWREIIEGVGCGLLVDPLSPKSIAEAIEYVVTHPEQSAAMGSRGRTAVESHYNWEREERELLRLYAELGQPNS